MVTQDLLQIHFAVTRIRNRNKVLDKASRAYEQLSYFTEIIIVKGLLDMDRT
jgi:hypothetical protein